MTVGETINRLRTEKNMSQGDLAEVLDVSRQSVSKWETGASVPELDKLLKMAELFGVTLDELVCGKAPESPKSDQTPPQKQPVAGERRTNRILGFCLLGMVVLELLVLGIVVGLSATLILALPLLFCGIIVLTAKHHPALWCAWTLCLLVDAYLRYATGLNWSVIRHTLVWEASMNYTRLAVAWCQFLGGIALMAVTVWRLGKEKQEPTEGDQRRFLKQLGLFLFLSLPFGTWIFQKFGLSLSWLVQLLNWIQDTLRLILLTAILTTAVRKRT